MIGVSVELFVSETELGEGPDLAVIKLGTDAEECIHRPFAVRRHQDERAGRRRPAADRLRGEGNLGRADVVGEDTAELVVSDLANERRRTCPGLSCQTSPSYRRAGRTLGDVRRCLSFG